MARSLSRQQIISALAALGIDEADLTMVRHIEMNPRSVRITRSVRVESGGVLAQEHVEIVPIVWRES